MLDQLKVIFLYIDYVLVYSWLDYHDVSALAMKYMDFTLIQNQLHHNIIMMDCLQVLVHIAHGIV